MKVSVLLLTHNEERNLPRCLAAISWCDDILLVDSGSADATIAIARRAGARVLVRPFDNFASQRNFGLAAGELRHEWVLHLDADEVITPAFRDRLDRLQPPPAVDAYRVPSKTMLHEYWLRYAGMYPTYQVRLGHRKRLRFKQVGHGQREDLPPERVGTFDEPYLHYNFSHGLSAWLRKHLKYAEDEARHLVAARTSETASGVSLLSRKATNRRRALKELSGRIPLMLRPLARFLYVLFWRRGFLDGRHGLLYAFMLAVYEGMIAIIATDLTQDLARPKVESAEAASPNRLLRTD
jgi:glycosyltransferase involved in cell wall biosynthesis